MTVGEKGQIKPKTAIIFSSVDGQTLKISEKILGVLRKNGRDAELFSIDDFAGDVTDYELLVLGASIRYGVHDKKVMDFINNNKIDLDSIKTAFFSVNLVARKQEKNKPDTNPYVIKFFKSIDWNPDLVEVFAGKLDYKKYPYFDRIMIQLIMWITKGPTNTDAEIEYTNWDRVNDFGNRLLDL